MEDTTLTREIFETLEALGNPTSINFERNRWAGTYVNRYREHRWQGWLSAIRWAKRDDLKRQCEVIMDTAEGQKPFVKPLVTRWATLNYIERAIAVAAIAHNGQVDKGGRPYILHPLRVMQSFSDMTTSCVVAALHDVVEDAPEWSFERLGGCFTADVIEALEAITRRRGEGYQDYLERVKGHPIARKVKLADLADNLRRDRIFNPTEEDQKRWEKYEMAVIFLENESV